MDDLQRKDYPQARVIRLNMGRLTASSAAKVLARVRAAGEGAPALIVDLSEVEFMDSTAIGELVVLTRRLREAGQPYCLAELRPPLMSLARLMRLERALAFCDSVDTALASFAKPAPQG
ncbi:MULTISPECIES: STAS domain-containing protein [Thiorhodovibrio]|uniref:STAS domain-containing protein n=1 Tax=Thiorhodovibrio TaxID=61593 RepID=UPI001911A0B5|nr:MULTISPECIES: STAS domain-containing protein [Thiorhodovibrio]MBK5969432.1 hypothetical protein [Thiorhodovibrio winogradskyi]WPL11024.1 Putative anti-sigma factor antagonist [Thiorhodovibrio litoralis]